MTNQSELEQFIREHTFADFAPGGDGSDVVMVDPEVLADYITANYTANSEVDEVKAKAYQKGYIDGGIAELTKE